MHCLETCLVIAEADSFCHLILVQNERQLLSRFFCYSWLVCLLGFWLRNAPLFRVIGNPSSDGIVFKNEPLPNLAGCVGGLKSLRRFWPYLMALRSCIATGKPE